MTTIRPSFETHPPVQEASTPEIVPAPVASSQAQTSSNPHAHLQFARKGHALLHGWSLDDQRRQNQKLAQLIASSSSDPELGVKVSSYLRKGASFAEAAGNAATNNPDALQFILGEAKNAADMQEICDAVSNANNAKGTLLIYEAAARIADPQIMKFVSDEDFDFSFAARCSALELNEKFMSIVLEKAAAAENPSAAIRSVLREVASIQGQGDVPTQFLFDQIAKSDDLYLKQLVLGNVGPRLDPRRFVIRLDKLASIRCINTLLDNNKESSAVGLFAPPARRLEMEQKTATMKTQLLSGAVIIGENHRDPYARAILLDLIASGNVRKLFVEFPAFQMTQGSLTRSLSQHLRERAGQRSKDHSWQSSMPLDTPNPLLWSVVFEKAVEAGVQIYFADKHPDRAKPDPNDNVTSRNEVSAQIYLQETGADSTGAILCCGNNHVDPQYGADKSLQKLCNISDDRVHPIRL